MMNPLLKSTLVAAVVSTLTLASAETASAGVSVGIHIGSSPVHTRPYFPVRPVCGPVVPVYGYPVVVAHAPVYVHPRPVVVYPPRRIVVVERIHPVHGRVHGYGVAYHGRPFHRPGSCR